jgi:small GTP-binding protein
MKEGARTVATAISKKVCLLGDFATGKTSLVRRFVYDRFDDKYISTIGVKVSRKTISVPCSEGVVELTMMLWDLAGSEEFNRVRTSYLRGSAGAVVVCDLTRPETLETLQRQAGELWAISPGAQLVLAANKRDLVEPSPPAGLRTLDAEQVQAGVAGLGAPYYLTSAKTGDEVEELFRHLGRLLVGTRF